MRIEIAGKTDVGRKRKQNEDAYLVLKPPQQPRLSVDALLLVADGMGGHERGEVASGHVRDVFEAVFVEQYAEFLTAYTPESLEAALKTLYKESHSHLRNLSEELASSEDSREQMGTTLTVGLIAGDQLVLAHVGDSRAYLLRNDMIAQLTEDHTMAQLLVRAGKMTEEEAAKSRYSHALSQAIGASKRMSPDLAAYPLEPGDTLLLCTDGLTRYLQEADLMAAVQQHAPAAACDYLVDLANQRGGRDNITVVIARVQPEVQADTTAAAD